MLDFEQTVRHIALLTFIAILLAGSAGAADEPIGKKPATRGERNLFRAGADATAIAPATFPVLINGNFLQDSAKRLNDPIHAKSLVLDDGSIRLAIVVVDSCMMPRELLDRAKALAHEKTGIPTDRISISATHTHSAPAAMGALGCPADANYAALLPGRIAESIEQAAKRLEAARVGWNVIEDRDHTFCRRWVRRPDRMLEDPFGERNVRANMHPGYQNPDAIAPAGPVDPALTVLSVQSTSGRPIAVLANYSMHYYGGEPVSADYFGRFASALAKRIGAEKLDPQFVAIMSQGTSGDQMWMDYGQPKKDPGIDSYADAVARFAQEAYQSISYHNWVSLAMAEVKLVLGRRVPDERRLAWARGIVERMGSRALPKSLPEVYAKEAVFLHDEPRRELKLQAIRIGELGITAIPNELFAITGLKIKAQSPFETTMNIELANGSEGYIPPPEQHALGGYTTWPARTAGLEVQAEPRIVEAVLRLLEQVAETPRRVRVTIHGPYARSVIASKPLAYWRLDEIEGSTAVDFSGHNHRARYEGLVAHYLPGPPAPGLSLGKGPNRAVYFAGGRLEAELESGSASCSIELWFWNGLPNDARAVTGVLFTFDTETSGRSVRGSLGIGGAQGSPGRLFFSPGTIQGAVLTGKAEIRPKVWHHVALVRSGLRMTVYLDGKIRPDMDVAIEPHLTKTRGRLAIGGPNDSGTGFEGMIAEVAVYDRALAVDEIVGHVKAAQGNDQSKPDPSR